jgi:excisionase family DNA binding protein
MGERTLLSTSEVAALFSVGSTTVKAWATTGKLPYLQTSGGWFLFWESDVRKLLDGIPLDQGE